MALNRAQAIRLAQALRSLRISTWPDREVTESQLAKALSSEGRVAGPTPEFLGITHESQDTAGSEG